MGEAAIAGRQFVYSYRHAATLKAFAKSDAFIRGLMGPVGSGKSACCVVELLKRAQAQRPGPDGIRRTRWAIIRNTYGELRSTTIKTVEQWLPRETFGDFHETNHEYTIRAFPGCEIEFVFLALDSPRDVKKLLSLELTGAWVNEAREVPWSVIEVLQGRLGRFPPIRDGGPSWRGLIMDTNPPDADSHWYRFFEEADHLEGVAALAKVLPGGMTVENYAAIFKQPSGLDGEAENLPNLEPGYYQRQAIGKSREWVNVYLRGQYGFVMEGLPVFPEFQDHIHVSASVKTDRDTPVIRGWDYGLQPSCIFSQLIPSGQLITVDEIIGENIGIARFSEAVLQHCKLAFPKRQFLDVGDPAGNSRAETDERTCFEIQQSMSIDIEPAPQTLSIRLESMRKPLNSMRGGKPGFLLHERCKTLRRAFLGGYHFKKMGKVDGEWQQVPNKNRFSHPMDGQTYIAAYLFGDSLTTVASGRGRDDDEVVFSTNSTRNQITGY